MTGKGVKGGEKQEGKDLFQRRIFCPPQITGLSLTPPPYFLIRPCPATPNGPELCRHFKN